MFSPRLLKLLDKLGQSGAAQRLGARIAAAGGKAAPRLRFGLDASAEGIERFWAGRPPELRDRLVDGVALTRPSTPPILKT